VVQAVEDDVWDIMSQSLLVEGDSTPEIVTATPPLPPGFTPAPPATPTVAVAWQTSAPREPVPTGGVVELGIRNENGAPGETQAIGVQVNLPDGSSVSMQGTVVGEE